MTITYSEIESDRFQLSIYRGNSLTLNIPNLKKILSSGQVDIIIFRLPTTESNTLHLLNKLNKTFIVTDTLVYYEEKLHLFKPNSFSEKMFDNELFTEERKEVIEDIVRETFSDYSSHYQSNPWLESQDITDGYVEWAVNYINLPNSYSLLLKYENKYAGFITTKLNSGKEAEIILNGVMPEYEGKGIYRYALNEIRKYYKSIGVESLYISTQIQNTRVQNIWITEGFQMKNSCYTIHINNEKK